MQLTLTRDVVVRRAGAAAAIAVLAAGAMLGGMGPAADAALFSLLLAVLLALALLASPRTQLIAVARTHAVTLAAAIAFILWSWFTAQISPASADLPWSRLFHPLWSEFQSPNRAISLSPYRTLEGIASFVAPACAFVLGALVTRDRKDRDFIGRIFIGAAIAIAAYCLFLLVRGAAASQGARLIEPFGSSNAAATLFGVLAIFVSVVILRAARGRLTGARTSAGRAFAFVQNTPIALAAFALLLACLLLTGSRAGLAALAGGFVLFFALTRAGAGQSGRGQSAFALVAALAAIFLLIGGDFLLSRFGTFGVDAEGRRLMIETHFNAFLDRPILGHGLNTFHELNAHYANVENWPALRDIGAAHNIFVQMLEETGLVGAAFFMLMLAPPLARALQIAVEDRSGAEWAAAAFAAAAFVFAHGLVDFGLQVPAIAATLAFGLGAFSSARMERKPKPAAPPPPDPRAGFRFRPTRRAA